MFGKLKDKLKSWTKKISEKAEEEIPEKEEPKKEVQVPVKYNVGAHKYEPDLEKLEEIKKEVQSEQDLEKFEEVKKEISEEPKPGEKGFLKKITSRISKIKISEKEFEIYSDELEMLLLENNVALEVAEKMVEELKEEIIGKEFLKKEIEGEIKDCFKKIIEKILIEPFDIAEKIKEKKDKPYVILFCGINGSGKTTTIAKIADSLKRRRISCVLAAADTFRAASIEQIKEHSEKIGIKTISHEYGSDPASVGFDAIKYAEKNSIDCVLIDTAGRMHTSKNLLKEIEKISRVCEPDIKIFVGESITGNDVIEQAKTFNWEIKIDGIVLTKADIDEKGGTALSVGYVTKKPILYLGTGQHYDDIEVFDKGKFIEKLGL